MMHLVPSTFASSPGNQGRGRSRNRSPLSGELPGKRGTPSGVREVRVRIVSAISPTLQAARCIAYADATVGSISACACWKASPYAKPLDRQAQGPLQYLRPPRSRPALPRAERQARGLRFPLLAEAVPRSRNETPAPILLLVRPHSRYGAHARACRRQATLLRGPRGPFPAQAGVAPPKAS